jgi:hypothetical protein
MDNSRMGCINRDKMDAKHPKLFDSYMEKGEIPLKYRRLQSQQDMLTTTSQIA